MVDREVVGKKGFHFQGIMMPLLTHQIVGAHKNRKPIFQVEILHEIFRSLMNMKFEV